MSKKYEKKGWAGDTYWEDENCKRTYEKKDWAGNIYYEDEKGNKTYEKKDWSGDTYWEDDKGNKTYEKKDWSGDTYWEDEKGNKTYEKKDFMGNRYIESSNGKTTFPGHITTDDYKDHDGKKVRGGRGGGGGNGSGCSGYLIVYIAIIAVLTYLIAFLADSVFHVHVDDGLFMKIFYYLIYGSISVAIVLVIAFLIIPAIKFTVGIKGLLIIALLLCIGPVLVYFSLDAEQKSFIKASITSHLDKEKNQGQSPKLISPEPASFDGIR